MSSENNNKPQLLRNFTCKETTNLSLEWLQFVVFNVKLTELDDIPKILPVVINRQHCW